jgi:hypothetical protein
MCVPADAVIGVSMFGDDAPESLGSFSLAFVALFRIAAGETSVALTTPVGLSAVLLCRCCTDADAACNVVSSELLSGVIRTPRCSLGLAALVLLLWPCLVRCWIREVWVFRQRQLWSP